MLRALRIAACGMVALAAATLPAFAHAHLVSEFPAADSSVTAPGTLVLHFSEGIEPGFTGLTLKDSTGNVVATGPTVPDSADPATIGIQISGKLAAGRYEVAWHALAVDGHKTGGSYGFTVAP